MCTFFMRNRKEPAHVQNAYQSWNFTGYNMDYKAKAVKVQIFNACQKRNAVIIYICNRLHIGVEITL